jgi:hypothetical protein
MIRRYRNENPKSQLSTPVIGIIAEHRVIVDLLTRGYDVFHAASPACSCDLAVLKNGNLLRVEVTTGKYTPTRKIFYPPHNKNNYDIVAAVLPDQIYYFPDLPPLKCDSTASQGIS